MRDSPRMVANEACGLSVVASSLAFANAAEPSRRASGVVPYNSCKPPGGPSGLMPLSTTKFSVWALKSNGVS